MSEQDYEFIPAGKESKAEKAKSQGHSQGGNGSVEDMVRGMGEQYSKRMDEEIENNDLAKEEVGTEYVRMADLNQIKDNYESILKQSKEFSNEIADTIHIQDLGDESVQMLEETITDLSRLQHQKTLPEKIVNYLPSKTLREKAGNVLNVAEKQLKRNQTVKDFATRHFKELQNKQEYVDKNRISVDKIKQGLAEQSVHLTEMLNQAKGTLQYMEETGEHDLSTEIQGKQLVTRISQQLVSQSEIIEQTLIYESIASVVSEHIEATLPQIQNQFIDQVSVTSSLKNLKDLQDSVQKTKELVLDLKTEGLKEMDDILDSYEKEGIGESDKARKLRKQHRSQMSSLRKRRDTIQSNYLNELDSEIERSLEDMEHIQTDKKAK